MTNILRTKFTRIRKYAFRGILTIVLYTLFYRIVLICLTLYRFKFSNYCIANLSYNSSVDKSCTVSIQSDMISPMYVDIHSFSANAFFNFNDQTHTLCSADLGLIELSKFGDVSFTSTLSINYLDLSKISEYLNSGSPLYFEFSMVISLRFLLIPLTFGINRQLIKFDKINAKDPVSAILTNKDEIIDDFFTSLNIKSENFSSKSFKNFNFLKTFTIEKFLWKDKKYNKIVFECLPFHGLVVIKNVNLSFHYIKLKFSKPFEFNTIIKNLEISSSKYKIEILIPEIINPNIVVRFLRSYWESRSLKVEIDQITQYLDESMSTKQHIYTKTDQKNLASLSFPITNKPAEIHNGSWKIRNLTISKNMISGKFSIKRYRKTLLVGSIIQHLAEKYIPDIILKINNEYFCKVQLILLNPIENMIYNCSEFIFIDFKVIFNDESKISLIYGNNINDILKHVDISFQSEMQIMKWVNHLIFRYIPNKPLVLINDDIYIEKYIEKPIINDKINIQLNHIFKKPQENEIFRIESICSNTSSNFNIDSRNMIVEIPNVYLSLILKDINIKLKTKYNNFVGFDPNTGLLKYNIQTLFTFLLTKDYESFDYEDLINLLNEDFLLEINSDIKIPIKVINQQKVKIPSTDADNKVFVCLDIKEIITESESSHCLKISPNYENFNKDRLESCVNNSLLTINNKINIADITKDLVLLDNFVNINSNSALIHLNIYDEIVVIKSDNEVLISFNISDRKQENSNSVTNKLLDFLSVIKIGTFLPNKSKKIYNGKITNNIKIDDLRDSILVDLSIAIPNAIFKMPLNLRISFINHMILNLSSLGTNSKNIMISLSCVRDFHNTEFRLHVEGGFDVTYDRYSISLLFDGKSIYEKNLNRKMISEIYDQFNKRLAITKSKQEKENQNVNEKTTTDSLKSLDQEVALFESQQLNKEPKIYIEPLSFNSWPDNRLELEFNIYSDFIDKKVQETIISFIDLFKLDNQPEYFESKVELSNLPFLNIISYFKPDLVLFEIDNLSINLLNESYKLTEEKSVGKLKYTEIYHKKFNNPLLYIKFRIKNSSISNLIIENFRKMKILPKNYNFLFLYSLFDEKILPLPSIYYYLIIFVKHYFYFFNGVLELKNRQSEFKPKFKPDFDSINSNTMNIFNNDFVPIKVCSIWSKTDSSMSFVNQKISIFIISPLRYVLYYRNVCSYNDIKDPPANYYNSWTFLCYPSFFVPINIRNEVKDNPQLKLIIIFNKKVYHHSIFIKKDSFFDFLISFFDNIFDGGIISNKLLKLYTLLKFKIDKYDQKINIEEVNEMEEDRILAFSK